MGLRARQPQLNFPGSVSSCAKWRELLYRLQRLPCGLNEIMCEKCLTGGLVKMKHWVNVCMYVCVCVCVCVCVVCVCVCGCIGVECLTNSI